LRLDALRRIAAIDAKNDNDRLLSHVSEPAESEEHVLDSWEAENLLALAEAAGRDGGALTCDDSKLESFFINSHRLRVTGKANFKTTDFSKINLTLEVSRNLAVHFSRTGNKQVINNFFTEFDRLWNAQETVDFPLLSHLFFALTGCLEGISSAKNPDVIENGQIPRFMNFCVPEFYENAQKSLEIDRAFDTDTTGVMNMILAALQVVQIHAEVNHSENPAATLEFAKAQLDQLGDSYEYHAQEVTPLVEQAIDAVYRIIEADLPKFSPIEIWELVKTTITETMPENPQLAGTLSRLTAKLLGKNEQHLADYFELLLQYLTSLPPHSSAFAIKEFMPVFSENFRTESSRTKLVYTVTNLLSPGEYEMQAEGGENRALEFVGSLLSILIGIITSLQSPELVELAVAVLDQKKGTINDEVDSRIVETWGLLGSNISPSKFPALLQQILRTEQSSESPAIAKAVKAARVSLAKSGAHITVLLSHLLDLIIMNDGKTVRNLIMPVAIASEQKKAKDSEPELEGPWHWLNKQRNAWFNLAALGYHSESFKGEDLHYLCLFARNSPPLVSEESANHVESDLKINAVLCRGAPNGIIQTQQNVLAKRGIKLTQASTIPTLFLSAALMLEELCCQTGVISRLPHYFADAEVNSGGEANAHMLRITNLLVTKYIANWGYVPEDGLVHISQNLKELIALSCHRVDTVRDVAKHMTTKLVQDIPSSLCQPTSLYAMFHCLTLLGDSTKNAAEDEYSPRAVFESPKSGIRLELSDNALIRQECCREFEKNVNDWLAMVNSVLSADLRSKMYNYLNRKSALGRGRRSALEFLSSEDASDDFVAHCILLSRYEANQEKDSEVDTVSARASEILTLLQSARTEDDLQAAYAKTGPFVAQESGSLLRIVQESVAAPFRIFTEQAFTAGITFWYHILGYHPDLRSAVVTEIVERSILSAKNRRGLFSNENDTLQPLWTEMEYAPTNKKVMDREDELMRRQIAPHSRLIDGFLRSCMYNSVLMSSAFLPLFARLSEEWLIALITGNASKHSLARNLRLEVLVFSVEVLRFLELTERQAYRPVNKLHAKRLKSLIVRAALDWYIQPSPQWSFGSNLLTQRRTLRYMTKFARYLRSEIDSSPEINLLYQLLSQEFEKIAAWYEPLGPGSVDNRTLSGRSILAKDSSLDSVHLRTAWNVDPHLAVSLLSGWRLRAPNVFKEIEPIIRANPLAVYNYSPALHIYLGFHEHSEHHVLHKDGPIKLDKVSHVLLYWHQTSPIESINLLVPPFCYDNTVTQYALRSLQTHDIAKAFFYVPQIVQQLHFDDKGYVQEYILEAGKYSPKFAHQIIWNMKANMYMDDDATVESPLKPKLEAVLERMVSSFDPEEKKYYDTEFAFFGEVTSISGKLKPFIKKSKAEKKEKIDEEIRQINVPEGVYLPSHPDGVVLDIDRTSGKPLQSHAKAPFLAKFKIRTDVQDFEGDNLLELKKTTRTVMQGAIFKVGDDCRQDVLALQIISVFRSIFNFCGLDVYVFPYKVTATEAGRGVIDVLPNSTSRDMLGREFVNGLDQWYRSKHGGPNSINFQKARLNFVKSMAAYSVISYLIQFKDRHNGNIMYDDEGHLVHIDFGFCFDISPGGVRFEAAPFKLTKEMVNVMGGNTSMPYKWFEELCIRAFLASRVYADDICRIVEPMLASGLPCFKPQTMENLRSRFALDKTEAQAAKFMRGLIKKSYESNFTKVYDEFQRVTNGIPY